MRRGHTSPPVDIVHTVASIVSRAKITNVLTQQITYVIIDLNAALNAAPPPQADCSLTIEDKPSLHKQASGRRDLRRESGRTLRKAAAVCKTRASLIQDSQQHVTDGVVIGTNLARPGAGMTGSSRARE